jgi:glycosyltransferase involved in cell wall biosynthesis
LLHAVDTRDSRIEQLQAELQDRFAQASVLQKLLAEADAQVAALRRQLLELDTQTATAAAQAMAAREQQMQEFQIKLSAHEAQILELHHAVGARDSQIAALKHEVRTQLEQIETMMQSSSWRLTKPLRALRRGLPIGSSPVLRGMLSDRARQVWRHLPMSVSKKQKLKSAIFQGVPFLFRHTLAYRTWVNCQSSETRAGLPALQVPQRANVLEPVPYVPLLQAEPLFQRQAKLICFYLPQFHPIPENDAWWGEGFTEWTNVRPAQPQFEGHYQPRIPGELGYYSLLDPAVQRRQIELARLYGIEGFCFYFYWFGGKRLLETPTENYLNNPELDLPFCLCWANENWSRRWDGLDSEVLMAQNHSAEDDLAFISYIAKYLRDPRYIRIDSKPLLLVYRPSLLPDMRATTARWRTWCRENGVGEIYLAYTQSFETVDPRDYDFDAAIEFPPNNSAPPNITDSIKPITEDFSGIVYDWRVFPERSENYTPAKYTLFRSVCPAWDNTARRKNRGAIFHHNTPQLYQRWLTNAIDDTCRHRANPDERIIFINAWNEWAEGAYLEPDARFGYAYLQVTRNALAPPAHESGNPRRLVLVTHDAYPHGAQLLTLNMARVLHEQFGFHVDLVCLGDGPLKPDFARHAQLHDLAGIDPRGPEAMALAKRLFAEGQRHALVNTTVSGFFLQTLARSGLRCVALVHELRGVLDQMGLHDQAHAIALHAFKAVFPANEVADSFLAAAPMDPDKIIVRPQGLYKRRNSLRYTADDRSRLRERLSLPPEAKVVLGVGYADHRKGVDLFVRAGLLAARQQPDVYWVWIGHWERNMQAVVSALLAKAPEVAGRFVFPGLQEDTDVFYGGADVFALTSREDPFPSVVLESLDAGVPVVAFEGSGGCLPMIKDGCGLTAPYEDVDAFAAAVNRLLQDNELRSSSGEQGRARVARDFSFRHYLFDLLDLLGCGFRRVSVVVPNFNYERFIEERLASVVQQDYPVYELLFLDDCSSDQSVDRARRYLSGQPVDFKILANQMNSGSVFKQWKRGIDHSRTELIWIAEADDACDPSMLTHVVKGFDVPGVVLSYCESKQMAEDGSILDDSYRAYVADVSEQRWNSPYVNDGLTEISEALSIKNSIPNASAVVFDAKRLKSVLDMHLDQISSYRVAGDWMTYILTLREGKIAYCPLSLNLHRRHGRRVTIGSFDRDQLDEIQRVQTFIADTFEVSEEKKSIAKHYLSSLVKQFGL